MSVQVEAVYEDGVLRLLHPLDLADHEVVTIRVTRNADAGDHSEHDTEYAERLRREQINAEPAVGLAELRRRLSVIPGCMAEEIMTARGAR